MVFLKNKNRFLLLAILSGVLLWLSWPLKPLGFLLHVAFVPLLMIEFELSSGVYKKKALKFFGYSYLALLIWNIGTTWWVYNATAWGGIFAIVANAFLMCIPLMLFYFTKKSAGNIAGYFSLIVYWLAFEYIHLNWDLTWPWLTLGNGFASLHYLVQWYEFTGHLGGSLWILIGNLLVFTAVRMGKINPISVAAFSMWFAIPSIISLVMYFSYEEKGKPVEVVVVQPNIDPYTQKFETGDDFIPYDEQIARMKSLSEEGITKETDFVLWPETALPYGYYEHQINTYPEIMGLQKFAEKHPNIELVTGLDSYVVYGKEKGSPTARESRGQGYYDVFNAAISVDTSGQLEIYHKSKLVPGVEYIPPYIKNIAIDLGGTVGGLGISPDRSVFYDNEGVAAAPVICYESIFGEFVTEYVREGAQFIAIITNDGWWGNTPGHKQHMQYAKLRSIETRKAVARSANTGTSGFINQKGDILKSSGYWEQAVLRDTILANQEETFYVKYGDYIGISANYFAMLCLVIMFGGIFVNRKKSLL